MHEKIAYAIKHYAWVQFLYKNIISFAFRLLGVFVGFDDHLVLLSSMSGDNYSGSPKALYDAMRKDPRYKKYRYVWAFSHPEKYNLNDAKTIKIDSLAYFITALQAKIWITDVNIERGLHFKKKKTIYLNTWHGTGPKKGGNAVAGRKDYDFSYVDIVCVDGKYARDEMVKWFNAKDQNLLWCGRPREDELLSFTEKDAVQIRNELNIPKNKKVILYMPTWREYGIKPLDYEQWEAKLSSDFVVLMRAHHFSKEKIMKNNGDFWIDVTNYQNVNKLYYVADYLVSDYSSAFFDFGLLGRPMICFAYDYEQYEASNGLLMDLKNEFPNGLMKSDCEVIELIKEGDYKEESIKCKMYCDGYVKHSGNATKACIDRIAELLN